jgi:hypothetical protein
MQWLQDPNQSNIDKLNSVRREASRHFRNKKREYLKAKVNEHETNTKNQNIRDLCRGIKGYQPRTNIIKDKKGNLVADPPQYFDRWRTEFSQLLNVHGVNDVRQMEIHTVEPLMGESNAFEVDVAIGKLKRHKSLVMIKL